MSEKVISLVGVSKSYRSYKRDIDRALEILTGKSLHEQYDALQPLTLQVAKGEVIGSPRGGMSPELEVAALAKWGPVVGPDSSTGHGLWPCHRTARRHRPLRRLRNRYHGA